MTSIATFWDSSIVPTLVDYIRIPAKSPHFDRDWAKNGHIDRAVTLAADWCRRHALDSMQLEVVRLPGRTPVLLIEVPAYAGTTGAAGRTGSPPQGTVLLYGHLDKQPEMSGWAEGLGPWLPVLKDGKLYGRGGADDGYAVFAAVAALRELQEETGFTASKLRHLSSFWVAPGWCTQVIHAYLAMDLTPSRLAADDDENITVDRVPLERVPELIAKGEIQDAKSIAALMLALRTLEDR